MTVTDLRHGLLGLVVAFGSSTEKMPRALEEIKNLGEAPAVGHASPAYWSQVSSPKQFSTGETQWWLDSFSFRSTLLVSVQDGLTGTADGIAAWPRLTSAQMRNMSTKSC